MRDSVKANAMWLLLWLFSACSYGISKDQTVRSHAHVTIKQKYDEPAEAFNWINPGASQLSERFQLPPGFERVETAENSFANYLRQLPLKADGSEVMLYNGVAKPNQDVHMAVVDLEIGTKDLHQCADAIMRVKAEYHWHQGEYEKIHFNFTNGFQVDYAEWMKGRRMVVEGNKTYWNSRNAPSNTYEDFWKYMELIFTYAGTHSLQKELLKVDYEDLAIGDVFIQGGFPGHAVLVVDMAYNASTSEKIFLLAQSYMPAQEMHVLKNYNDQYGPWYVLGSTPEIITPEWTFNATDLRRFSW